MDAGGIFEVGVVVDIANTGGVFEKGGWLWMWQTQAAFQGGGWLWMWQTRGPCSREVVVVGMADADGRFRSGR